MIQTKHLYNLFFKNQFIDFKLISKFSKTTKQQQVPRQFQQPIRTKFNIVDKLKLNHDCYIYKFNFKGPRFSLKAGQHFKLIKTIATKDFPNGQQITRMYTPITTCKDFQNNKIQLLLKIYRQKQNKLYPQGGVFTPYFEKMKIGQEIDVQGPIGKFCYQSQGKIQIAKTPFSRTKKVYNIKKIFFIAGGTGITPMFQTIQQIVKDPQDKTQVILLFCNRNQQDIILRKQIQSLRPKIKTHFMIQNPRPQWKGLNGVVNKQILNQIYPLDNPDTFYLYCGPKGMNLAISNIFSKYYKDSKCFKI